MTMGERNAVRVELDCLPDFIVAGKEFGFRNEFRTLALEDSFCEVPLDVVQRAQSLLDLELVDHVAKTVHDTVVFELGCSRVPLFSLETGGRDRRLFKFRCVFSLCSAFLEVRLFSGVFSVKWVMMGTSHSHDFQSFPKRMPRGTFSDETLKRFEEMICQNKGFFEVAFSNNVLCNKHVLQNALRPFRLNKKAEQTRELRDAVRASDLWNSEIHMNLENVFVDMFFVNRRLLSKRMKVDFVFVDDTACTNVFSFPVISVLCRSDSGSIHVVAWGFLENRTTKSFCRFFSFLFKHHPGGQDVYVRPPSRTEPGDPSRLWRHCAHSLLLRSPCTQHCQEHGPSFNTRDSVLENAV